MTHYALQGTQATYLSARHAKKEPRIWIDGRSPGQSPHDAAWESLWTYSNEYEHPRLGTVAGHCPAGRSRRRRFLYPA